MSDASAFLHFYKVYHLDKFGKIKTSALVMAADDADALQKVGAMATDHDVEVWDRARHIGTIEAGTVQTSDGSTLPTETLTVRTLSRAATIATPIHAA